MRFLSLFTGVGGFDLGLELAGMECAAQAETNKFALKVLQTHYPNVPQLGDVSNVQPSQVLSKTGSINLICGGFPCQDVSVAGLRAGLAGSRSGLWFEFLRIVESIRPQWVIVENVPGLLSSNAGRDFAVILQGLAQCGYGVGWRILDAQYFGVPQRRRRLFIVGHLGTGRAAEILFERNSGNGDYAAGQQPQQTITAADVDGFNRIGGFGWRPFSGIAPTLLSEGGTKQGAPESIPLVWADRPNGFYRSEGTGWKAFSRVTPPITTQGENPTNSPLVLSYDARGNDNGDVSATLVGGHLDRVTDYTPIIAFGNTGKGYWSPGIQTLRERDYKGESNVLIERESLRLRRLMPVECERLQGFPDNWTYGNSDTQRYRQIGNAVAVPVAYWLGRRIMAAGLE